MMNNESGVGRCAVRMLLLALVFMAGFSPDTCAPLHAQTAAPAETANGILLGAWNTQVEYDDMKVVAGTRAILSDAFDMQAPGWSHVSGEWQVANGVLRQTSGATPALMRFAFKDAATNYAVSVRARKLGGAEGFLVGFGARDAQNYYWLNLGGWNNTASTVEKSLDGERSPIGPRVNETIETARWYDLKIQVAGPRIQCFVDGRRIIELTDDGFNKAFAALPPDNDKLNFGRALIPDMVADPSIVDIDGTFYCYATTDGWGQGLATSGTPVVWTSKDFLNWSFEGSSFPSDFDLKYWAPSTVVHKNGRYYSFPTLDGKITTVVADSPLGPFVASDGQHVTKATIRPFPIEQNSTIDAEVFVDDDGQAYMVWSRRRLVKLKPDLLSPDGPMITVPTKREGYSEGPFLAKRNGIYYYFYTLGGNEVYQYAYMMSRTSPLGPWEAPEQDIIATTDHAEKVFGPGHGGFFHPRGSDQWYFVYLEYGRGGTTRQIFADKMNFNFDGTIQPIKLTKAGVGAIRPVANAAPNLALGARATASSTRPNDRVRPRSDRSLDRAETFAPANALDDFNGTRWLADISDTNAWFQLDLGAPRDIYRTEAYFVKPAAGHAYRLESSLDGKNWQPYGGHDEVILRSPHRDEKAVRARYLKLTILKGEPGLWEFRVYGEPGQQARADGTSDAAKPVRWGDWPRWGDQGDGTYRNPVLPSDYSDLDCIRVGSDYYAISSTFQYSPGMVILHSKDLVNWRILSHVIEDVTQIGPELNWDRMNRYGRGVWAGAIRHHAGKFWVYFGTPEEGYFMSTAKDAAGPWEPLHRMMNEGGWDDCCPFWDDDGQGYFIGTHFKGGYKTWLFKLTDDGRDLVPGSRVLLNEGSGREANKLYKINGTYYHLYSEHKPGVGRYVMMQRGTNIAGPYTEKRQLSHAQPEAHEPNQGGLVQTEQGGWYFFTHHGAGDWEGRPASLLPVTWMDGWPILGEVGSDGIGKMVWSGRKPVPSEPIVSPQSDDDFDGPKLGVQWEWNYQPRADKWSLTERPGFLRLHAFKPLASDNLKKAGNTLTLRSLRTSTNVVTLALDLEGMVDGQVAGLCHYSKDSSTIGVRRKNGSVTLESARSRFITNGPVLIPRKVWLRSTWGLDGQSRYSFSTNGIDFSSFGEPYQLGWGDYRGDRIGVFTYNNEVERGHVDCDSFTYHYDSSATRVRAERAIAPDR